MAGPRAGDCRSAARVPLQLPGLGGRGNRPSPEVIEAALAHVVRDRVEAAYARSDLFERRRVLMDDWARYLDQGIGCPHQVRQGGLARGRPGIEPHPKADGRQGQVD